MPSEVPMDPAVVTLTRNAAMKIAGHTRYPKYSKAARAIPVGAQTAVALGCTSAKLSPSLPVAR
jgi:hypothetical protein